MVRARFTIAHEIAHTLFYDITSKPPKLKVKITNTASLRSLELACNRAAAALVLPESLLELEFADKAFVKPEDLRDLANRALVSGQTVIRRFCNLRRLPHPLAILASITQRENKFVIEAISRHYAFRELLTGAVAESPLTQLVDDPAFLPFGGERRELECDFIGVGGRRFKMQFRCEGRTRVRSSSFFVTATVVDSSSTDRQTQAASG
jgi:hypothetical protein